MTAHSVDLTISRISLLEAPPVEQAKEQVGQIELLRSCDLKWRQDKLWIKKLESDQRSPLPALQSERWFRLCLSASPVEAVCLDLDLGEAGIRIWADACEQAQKPVFVRIPSTAKLPHKRQPLGWFVKCLADRCAAALLLVALSPVLLGLMGLIRLSSPGPLFFCQWRVGQRGKLFRVIKFRTMVADAEKLHHQVMGNQSGLHKRKDDPRVTALGRWMRKLSLDELPQLINVLRGEMSLVGPRPWALYDAVRISPESWQRLNALPGITGPWQVEARSTLLDIELVNQRDLRYLKTWSLWKDLKILLLTIPRVIAGFGAY